MTTNTIPVAIIGGGLSGLYTAYLLAQHGIESTVFEARARLGGRIVSLPVSQPSPHVDKKAERFDMGPSWFWPDMHPLMANLISELGLIAFEQYQTGAHLFDRGTGNTPQRHELGISTSPASMRLAGGMLSLIEALVAALPSNSIRLDHQLSAVSQLPSDNPTLSFDTPSGPIDVAAQHTIMALPLRLLSHIAFSPTLPKPLLQQCQSTPTWMAAHAKFVAVYEQPFWRKQGLSGSASSQTGPLVEIHDATTQNGRAALFGFIGVNALARKAAGRETLIDVTLNQLAALFGAQAASPVDRFLVDWSQEKFTAAKQDHSGANSHPSYGLPAEMATLWDNKIILSGTESSHNAGGYLEGALASAHVAVNHIHSSKTAVLR